MRLVAAIAACLLQAACFSPSEKDGVVECGPAGQCPPGFSCAGDGTCRRGASGVDAAIIDAPLVDASGDPADARLIDAPPPPDATSIDAGVVPACQDGIDNDCDGLTDYPDDPGCSSALDTDEHHIPQAPGSKACDDGIDNDMDGFTDYHAFPGCGDSDPQCSGPSDPSE